MDLPTILSGLKEGDVQEEREVEGEGIGERRGFVWVMMSVPGVRMGKSLAARLIKGSKWVQTCPGERKTGRDGGEG